MERCPLFHAFEAVFSRVDTHGWSFLNFAHKRHRACSLALERGRL